MNGMDQVVADAEARMDRLAMRFADDVDIIADETETITGQRPSTSIAGRANVLAARWGIVEHYREQARHLLDATRALEPLMAGKPGRGGEGERFVVVGGQPDL